MNLLFYISSAIAIIATFMVITRYHPIHALLYLVASFLSVAMIFLSLGAPFIAALEVIIYAGAIMVLFIFVVMMLNLGDDTAKQEKQWLTAKVWLGPSVLVVILLGELIWLILKGNPSSVEISVVDARKVSAALYGKYVVAVEMIGFLLMAGIVGAAHIGKHHRKLTHRFLAEPQNGNGADAIQEIQKEPLETVN
ncbi:MAG: NADH-quinone oxidoreductase subunit J [Bacteroidetes bacterium]|nr:MAG: NADH-quinone oxidoreductase subunit J [Bacteroidota bacterium]